MKRESWGRLALGLGTGLGFGFLLQKGWVAKHRVIVDQLLLKDWTVVKIMSTAVAVSSIGVAALQRRGIVEPKIKPLRIGGVTAGGTLFGAGMALLGYCPGTSLAAVGEGRRDALAGVLGMTLGAYAYTKLQPWLAPVTDAGDFGRRTLPQLTKTTPWLWIAGTSAAVATGAALDAHLN